MEYCCAKRTKDHTADVDIKSYCCVADSKYYPLWKTLTSKIREIKLLWATCCFDVVCYFSLTAPQAASRLFYAGRNVYLLSPILASLSSWPWSSLLYPGSTANTEAMLCRVRHDTAVLFRLIPPLGWISKGKE